MKKERLRNLIKQTARKLRQNQTKSEELLWNEIRNRKIKGKKFLRQYPVVYKWNNKTSFFILDFYCNENKLGVELDGNIHNTQKEYDKTRDYVINSLGIKILRFNNNHVDVNLPTVIQTISEHLS
jgi:very-short-patch-repair endonuclease